MLKAALGTMSHDHVLCGRVKPIQGHYNYTNMYIYQAGWDTLCMNTIPTYHQPQFQWISSSLLDQVRECTLVWGLGKGPLPQSWRGEAWLINQGHDSHGLMAHCQHSPSWGRAWLINQGVTMITVNPQTVQDQDILPKINYCLNHSMH